MIKRLTFVLALAMLGTAAAPSPQEPLPMDFVSCKGIAAWDKTKTYQEGDKVKYQMDALSEWKLYKCGYPDVKGGLDPYDSNRWTSSGVCE